MLKQIVGTALIAATFTMPLAAEVLWSVDQLEQPESAVQIPGTENIVISNISGSPMDVDGNGFLSLLDKDGGVIDLKWVQGLDAPKGMAILNGQLFVSDLAKLRIIDLASGTLAQTIEAEGAVFLNDVAASQTHVWVSDMMTHTIWQYQDGEFTKFLEDEALMHPNGLLFDDDRLIVGAWGAGMQADFSTKTLGSLLSIDLETKVMTPMKGAENIANLDGIVKIDDTLLVNDWLTGDVFSYKDGETKLVGQYPSGLADIASFGTTVLMPYMMNGKLDAFNAADWLEQ